MNSLRLAIGFMTILPVAPRDTPTQLASARAYFPLVGLVLGGILAALDFLLRPVLPGLLLSVVLITALIVLTRGLHLDGFMDTCDALLGGFTRERRLEIFKDSHVGAFAVIGVVMFLGIVSLGLMNLGRKWEQMEQTLERTRRKEAAGRKRDEAAMQQLQQAIKKLGQPTATQLHGPPVHSKPKPERRRRHR